jgi:excinuclease ABC subunit C
VPAEILTQHKLSDVPLLASLIKTLTGSKVSIRGGNMRGKKAAFDRRAIELAVANAGAEVARLKGSVDMAMKGADELARLLDLERPPRRIEAYDISHTQVSKLDVKPSTKSIYLA